MDVTIETYNKAAEAYANKFDTIGSRRYDIEKAFSLMEHQAPLRVIEWGCGNGRDAEVILEFTQKYCGIDASKEMIALAQERLPSADFLIADIASFVLPQGTDIVFAFASLLHCDKEAVRRILAQAHLRLSEAGLIYVSLKRSPYEKRIVTDEYGPRTFYFYEKEDIADCMGELYQIVHYEEQSLKGVDWLTIALQKM